MWIVINQSINNKLFSNDFEYLVKIETINKLGDSKTYIGLIVSVNTSDVSIECFKLNNDLSFSKSIIAYIDITKITSWYILNTCYSKLKYDY
jgi:hypothetical protein